MVSSSNGLGQMQAWSISEDHQEHLRRCFVSVCSSEMGVCEIAREYEWSRVLLEQDSRMMPEVDNRMEGEIESASLLAKSI